MSAVETLSDQMCCNTAVAVEALTNASDLVFLSGAGRKPVIAPTHGAVSHPALLSVGRGNPNSAAAAAVVNQQRPFGLEFRDVFVSNDNGFERVDDNQIVLSQNQLGSNPEQGCCGSDGGCCCGVDADVAVGSRIENSLSQKEGVEKQGDAAPNQIALRPKNRGVLHLSIIAGTPADGKGK